jgi:hypothetical protein
MKKLFFWICLLSFSFFTIDAMANLYGNESAIAENSEMNVVKKKHPRPFKCTVTYNFTIQGVGIGKATHLGFIVTESIFDPVSSTGIEKIHASNGDELDMTWTWDLADNTGIWQITGGTGRFEGATGCGDWSGVFIPDSPLFTINMTGEIEY